VALQKRRGRANADAETDTQELRVQIRNALRDIQCEKDQTGGPPAMGYEDLIDDHSSITAGPPLSRTGSRSTLSTHDFTQTLGVHEKRYFERPIFESGRNFAVTVPYRDVSFIAW
jgi:hypothetical protein